MTIQVVDITDFGIVMAADGAISYDRPVTRTRKPEHWRTKKLLQIPHLRAAIGFFGLAEIEHKPINKWLERFIHLNSNVGTMAEYAERLADALSNSVAGLRKSEKLGLHFSGYRSSNVGRMPEMHFIRNYNEGHEYPERKFRATEELLGNNLKHLTEETFLQMLADGRWVFFQNGYKEIYNAFSLPIVKAFEASIWPDPEFADAPKSVKEWGKITEFRLRAVRLVFEKFYTRRGHQPVGGRLTFIAIPSDPNTPVEEWSVGGR